MENKYAHQNHVAVAIHVVVNQRREPLHHPRHDDICHTNEFVQIGIVDAIGVEVASKGRNAQHHGTTDINRVVFQEVNQTFETDVANVVRTVGKTDTPNGVVVACLVWACAQNTPSNKIAVLIIMILLFIFFWF